MESGMMKPSLVEPLHAEAIEITSIMAASRRTASKGRALANSPPNSRVVFQSKIENQKPKV